MFSRREQYVLITVLLMAILLFSTGVDGIIQLWLQAHQTPFWDKTWRIIGDIGLGRIQMLGCLLIATLYTWKLVPAANRPPLLTLPMWLFLNAFFVLLRTYRLKFTRPTRPHPWHPHLGLVWHLPKPAQVWLLSINYMFSAGTVCFFLKMMIGRPRPKAFLWESYGQQYIPHPFTIEALYWSFPSGHTTTTFAIVALVMQLYPKYKYVWLGVGMVLAFARVGAITPHYMGDIMAGAVVGYAVAIFCAKKANVV